MNSIKLIPIKVERQTSQFNLIDCLLDSLNKNSQKLLDYDILTISSKFVSLSEGRFVKLSDISVSSFADVFKGDAVAINAFTELKNYGTGKTQKGPGEYALAMLSDKIRLASGKGDTYIKGIGNVEIKTDWSNEST